MSRKQDKIKERLFALTDEQGERLAESLCIDLKFLQHGRTRGASKAALIWELRKEPDTVIDALDQLAGFAPFYEFPQLLDPQSKTASGHRSPSARLFESIRTHLDGRASCTLLFLEEENEAARQSIRRGAGVGRNHLQFFDEHVEAIAELLVWLHRRLLEAIESAEFVRAHEIVAYVQSLLWVHHRDVFWQAYAHEGEYYKLVFPDPATYAVLYPGAFFSGSVLQHVDECPELWKCFDTKDDGYRAEHERFDKLNKYLFAMLMVHRRTGARLIEEHEIQELRHHFGNAENCIAVLDDKASHVRWAAAKALREFAPGGVEAIPALTERLAVEDYVPWDEEFDFQGFREVREAIVETLFAFGASAAPALLDLLDREKSANRRASLDVGEPMAYAIEIVNALADTLRKFETLSVHQLAGHLANLDFWLSEVQHCTKLVDEYRSRFENMKSAQAKAERDRPEGISSQSEYGPENIAAHLRAVPDTQLKAVRAELVDAAYRFLLRCHKLDLLDLPSFKDTVLCIGTGIDPSDIIQK